MFLTLKRNTLYTFVILLNLAYFTPGFASIDPEKPKQDQTEQGDGDNQEDVEEQEQDEAEAPQDSELEDSVNPTDTVEMNESPSSNLQIGIQEMSPEVIEPTSEADYYDEEEEDTSESVISFNFLYYLLQKFKFSDSMNY